MNVHAHNSLHFAVAIVCLRLPHLAGCCKPLLQDKPQGPHADRPYLVRRLCCVTTGKAVDRRLCRKAALESVLCDPPVAWLWHKGVTNNKLNLRTPSEVTITCVTHETAEESDPAPWLAVA